MAATVSPELRARGAFYVGYDNYLVSLAPTITADHETVGYEDDNLATWAWYEAWVSDSSADQEILVVFDEAVSINALGLAGHNLGTVGATAALQYSVNAGADWTQLIGLSPGDDKTEFRVSDGASATHWKLVLSGMTAAPEIGCLFIGPSVQMKDLSEGSVPPSLWYEDSGINVRSNTGAYLGRSVYVTGNRTRINLELLRKSWYDSFWKPFKDAYREHPFFMAWDADRYPDEGYFCFTDDEQRPDRYRKGDYVDVQLEVVAL